MKRVIVVAIAALSLGMLAPAHAGNPLVYASTPESQVTGWAAPLVVIQPGDSITYENLDPVAYHNVIAETADGKGNVIPQDIGSDSNTWCGTFAKGHCPIFWSETIGVAGPKPLAGKVGVPVQGIASLVPGTYTFYCSIHPNTMIGTLVVLPA